MNINQLIKKQIIKKYNRRNFTSHKKHKYDQKSNLTDKLEKEFLNEHKTYYKQIQLFTIITNSIS